MCCNIISRANARVITLSYHQWLLQPWDRKKARNTKLEMLEVSEVCFVMRQKYCSVVRLLSSAWLLEVTIQRCHVTMKTQVQGSAEACPQECRVSAAFCGRSEAWVWQCGFSVLDRFPWSVSWLLCRWIPTRLCKYTELVLKALIWNDKGVLSTSSLSLVLIVD